MTPVDLRHITEGRLLPALIRLALPTVCVLLLTTGLGVVETYFVSTLGVEAIAAASIVVPFMLLMTMVSNGGIGGGVSSSIARALGAGRRDLAESLAWHAVILGLVFGAVFSIVLIGLGVPLYGHLGVHGSTLRLALVYSNILFGGAVFFWVVMLLQATLRGAGNVKPAALIILCSVSFALALSPALILGKLGMPKLGIAGAGVAQVLSNVLSLVLLITYMRSSYSTLSLRPHRLQREHFRAILGVGLPSTLNAVMINVSITSIMSAVGSTGLTALAGYGIAARLEFLLIPLMFGFGTAVITVVGVNLGAGDVGRARRAAFVNAAFVAGLVELIGLTVALFPKPWIGIFTSNAAVTAASASYLHAIGPVYGFMAVTTELYFAGQGAQRIKWPLIAAAARLVATLIAAAAIVHAHVTLLAAFLWIAGGILLGGIISAIGTWRVRWGSAG